MQAELSLHTWVENRMIDSSDSRNAHDTRVWMEGFCHLDLSRAEYMRVILATRRHRSFSKPAMAWGCAGVCLL